MKLTPKGILLILSLLSLSTPKPKLLSYPVTLRQKKTVWDDLKEAFKALRDHPTHPLNHRSALTGNPVHDAIYALSLKHSRFNVAYLIDLHLGADKKKLSFMIDTGKRAK